MNSERFEQVNRHFIEASRLAGAHRPALLDKPSAGDPDLGRELEALLVADHAAAAVRRAVLVVLRPPVGLPPEPRCPSH